MVAVSQPLFFQNNLKFYTTQPLLKVFKKSTKETLKVFIFFYGVVRMLEKMSIFIYLKIIRNLNQKICIK
jgi:hypothetical protein